MPDIRIHGERTENRKCKKVDCIMNRIPYVKLQIDINYRNVLGVVYRLLNGWKNGCDKMWVRAFRVFSFKSDDRLDNRFSWIHRKSSRKIFTKMLYSSFVCFLVRINVSLFYMHKREYCTVHCINKSLLSHFVTANSIFLVDF